MAARAAYRLGAVDTLLSAVESGDVELAGIFVEVLRGERAHRIGELASAGVQVAELEDMRVKGGRDE